MGVASNFLELNRESRSSNHRWFLLTFKVKLSNISESLIALIAWHKQEKDRVSVESNTPKNVGHFQSTSAHDPF